MCFKQLEVWCHVVEKFHTAGCIQQGSVYFPVNHNLSLKLTDIYAVHISEV